MIPVRPASANAGAAQFWAKRFGWAILAGVWFASATTLTGQTTLIPQGSIWNYLYGHADPGTNWTRADFDDQEWSSGAAELGYGDGDETTALVGANVAGPTVYFRHAFFVDGNPLSLFVTATMRFLADDGAVLYLNGHELYRHNMPSGPVNHLTRATRQVVGDEEKAWIQRSVFRGYFMPGTNVLAVALHQSAFDEDDASFDLELVANHPLTPPTVRLLEPRNGQIFLYDQVTLVPELDDLDGHIYRVDYFANGQSIAEVLTPPFDYIWLGMPVDRRYRIYARAIDNSGRSSYSETVHVQVGTVVGESLTRGPYLQMGGTNRMTIKWRTDWFTDTRVSYGPNPGDWDHTLTDTNLAFDHEVHLTGLKPDQLYHYTVGSSGTQFTFGDDYRFRTSPAAAKPTRVWVIGDSGTANENAAAVFRAYELRTGEGETDVWLMLGDNAYEQGTDEEYQNAVFGMYDRFLRNTVLWPTIGNHDASLQEGGEFPYLNIFSLPRQAEAGGMASGTEAYYSFDYGNIHFICLDSQTSDRSPGAAMWMWLEADLAGANQDWIVAFWHHPPYSKGTHDSDLEFQLIEMRERALPILERYGADLVLSGHSHVYERSFLLDGHYGYSGSLHPGLILDRGSGRPAESGSYRKPTGAHGSHRGTVYAVCGCSGEGGGIRQPDHPAMFFSRLGFGSMILEFDGLQLDATFIDQHGMAQDSFRVVKGPASLHDGPRLHIQPPGTNHHFEVSWPDTLLPFQLEGKANRPGENTWKGMTNSPVRSGHRHRVFMDREEEPRWFRLRSVP